MNLIARTVYPGSFIVYLLQYQISLMEDPLREHRLKFCKVCQLRAFDFNKGVTCSLTGELAAFEGACPDYKLDEQEQEAVLKKEEAYRDSEIAEESLGLGKIGGVKAGIVVMVLSFVLLIAGIVALNKIFIWCIIGFGFGMIALFRGLKRKKQEGVKQAKHDDLLDEDMVNQG